MLRTGGAGRGAAAGRAGDGRDRVVAADPRTGSAEPAGQGRFRGGRRGPAAAPVRRRHLLSRSRSARTAVSSRPASPSTADRPTSRRGRPRWTIVTWSPTRSRCPPRPWRARAIPASTSPLAGGDHDVVDETRAGDLLLDQAPQTEHVAVGVEGGGFGQRPVQVVDREAAVGVPHPPGAEQVPAAGRDSQARVGGVRRVAGRAGGEALAGHGGRCSRIPGTGDRGRPGGWPGAAGRQLHDPELTHRLLR